MIMKTSLLILLLVAGFFAPASVTQEDDPDPIDHETAETFLAEVMKKYALPFKRGVASFDAGLKFRGGENPDLEWITEAVTVSYAWKAPAEERIAVKGVPRAFHGLVRNPLRGLWMDVVGGCVFPGIEEKMLSVEGRDEEIVLHISDDSSGSAEPSGTPQPSVPHRIVFDPATHLVLRAESSWEGTVIKVEPTYRVDENGLLRIESKRVIVEAEEEGRNLIDVAYEYGAFRFCGPNALPTKLTLTADGKRFTYDVTYSLLNGGPVVFDAADPKKVKALVKEFEKSYSKMDATGKRAAMAELEETGHELAVLSIAKKGLKDKDLEIRAFAARTLGAMKIRKALPALIKAMKPNERHVDVYLAIIKALGDLGDPKAIPYLSKNFWNQKEAIAGVRAAQAKITALGYIRSRKAVDALIDMLYVADPLAMLSVAAHLQASLKRLTGVDFGWDRDRWRDWWKKNKKKFKLEED